MQDSRPPEQPGRPGFELAPRAGVPAPARRPPPADYGLEEEGGLDYRRLLAAVYRYKWLILVLTVVGTVAGVIYSRSMESEYVAQATIWIETSEGRQQRADVGPIRSGELLAASAWVDLLRSFVVLDPVVREERLFLRPQNRRDSVFLSGFQLQDRFVPGDFRVRVDRSEESYVLETGDGARVEAGSFGDSVGTEVGFRWQPDLASFPADRPVAFHLAVPRDESLRLSERVQTRLDRTGNFLRLELRGQDPAQTASILNSLTQRYVEVAGDLKRAKLDELVEILDEQLAYAEQNLREAEIALEDFKIETITLPSERSTPIAPGVAMTRDPVFDNFFSMRVEMEQLRRDREALERALAGDGIRVEALEAIGPVQESSELSVALQELRDKRAELRALQYRYTEDYPPVRQLMEEVNSLETVTIPQLGRSLLNELAARQRTLEQSAGEASQELRQIPARAIEEARLERQVAIADNLYTTLQERYEEARLAAASSIPDVRVLDEAAVPRRPLDDQKLMVILMAFAGSLGLGLLGAMIRDRLDPHVRYANQLTEEMGLTILGGIPNMQKRNVDTEHATEVLESFRTIRLNLIHAYGAAGPLTFTISSPGPGDGKSFVSANLGLSFSELGHRTLLVDGDIRQGTLHQLMEMDRRPGLTDYLDGTLQEDRLVRRTRFDRLDVITSGSRLRHGPELLSSPKMRQLLMGLRGDYDVIIVDSPPLGAGVDPFALGTVTGHMLLVLRSGITNKEMAESKLEYLDRLPVRILGAVFNGVPKSPGYGYYRYSYLPGYGTWDEEPGRPPLQVESGS